jgi:peptidoglycan hydrolase-like protein with peptidoglycan-binding domain
MHVHTSVRASKAKYDDTSDWAIPGTAGATTPSAPPPPAITKRPTLKEGDQGADVRYLQKQLGIAVDGKFGPPTTKAVKAVQKKNELKADGIVGTYTWAALAK